ncbi:MAG TPA: HAMP domain-containing sensor histidine kinase [Thermoanaerobaculia bacterium]|jgi:signal transduction histidine kinase
MSARRSFLLVLALAVLALIAFQLFARRVSLSSFNFAGAREVRTLLDASMDDQKRLSRIDPARGAEYRRRFEEIGNVTRKLDVVALNRDEIARRYEAILFAVFATGVALALVLYAVAMRRRQRRLARLQTALEALSRGDVDITIADRSRDVIGSIAAMIEQTSRDIAGDRRRLQYLDHLAAWQEAARRHAHEIRTPLTAARLEVDRLVSTVSRHDAALAQTALHAQASIHEELDRLREFTREFTSFARVGQPRLAKHDLWRCVQEFCATFADAWAVELVFERSPCDDCMVLIDNEMFRQVLVNLCNNSALAGATRVTFRIGDDRARVRLEVADDGAGIDAALRGRLFEPYTTTRPIGEGMGLGLAISKKIMLDHGGDLELVENGPGATFRVTMPRIGASA